MRHIVLLVFIASIIGCKTNDTRLQKSNYWSETTIDSGRKGIPDKYRGLTLDFEALVSAVDSGSKVTIPLPDGTYLMVQLNKSSVMSEELAKKFPEIRSYEIVKEKGTFGRVDINPSGFYVMVTHGSQTFFVNPTEKKGQEYISYDKEDLVPDINNPFIDKVIKR